MSTQLWCMRDQQGRSISGGDHLRPYRVRTLLFVERKKAATLGREQRLSGLSTRVKSGEGNVRLNFALATAHAEANGGKADNHHRPGGGLGYCSRGLKVRTLRD